VNDNEFKVKIVADSSGVAPAVNATKGEIQGLNESIKALSASMQAMSAQMSAGMSKATQTAHGAGEAAKAAKHGAEEAGAGFEAMAHKIHNAAESVRTMQMRAKEFAELYVAMFAVEKVVEFARSMAEAAEKTKHLSEQFGMTVPEVQKLQGVATQTGMSIDALTRGFGIMDKNLVTSKGSSTAMGNAFKMMGVSIDDGRTQMQKFEVIAEKFKNLEDGPKKAALAMLLFGKSGKELIPVLNEGKDGLERLNKRTLEYGGVSEDAGTKGMALAESINTSKLAFSGVANVLTSALGPIMTEMVDGMNRMIKAFIDSYQSGGLVATIFNEIAGFVGVCGEAINLVIDVFKALWNGASEIVTALVGSIGSGFGVKIPSYSRMVAVAFNEVRNAIVILKDAILVAVQIIIVTIETLVETLKMFAKVAWDAFTLNWGSIEADWKAGTTAIANHAINAANKIKSAMAEAAAAMSAAAKGEAYTGGTTGTPEIPTMKEGVGELGATHKGRSHKPKKEKAAKDELVQHLEEELTARKTAWAMEQEAQGTAQAYSLQSEADYWQAVLARTNLSAKDRMAVQQKWLAAHAQLTKQAIAIEMDGFKQSEIAAGKNAELKLVTVRMETREIARLYGQQSTEYAAAKDRERQAERAAADQAIQLADEVASHRERMALAGVSASEAAAQHQVAMGLITNSQLLALERDFENQRWAIEQQGVQARIELMKNDPGHDPVALEKLNNQLALLEQQHQAKLTDGLRKAEIERAKIIHGSIGSMSSAWAGAISKMVTLQQGFTATIKGLWTGLQQAIGNAIGQMLQELLTKEITHLAVKLGLMKAEHAAATSKAVGEAGAGGVASMAAAPFPLNLGAPTFGASMAAAAASFGAVGFAEKGYDIPAGVNPLTQLHQREMVLPAQYADVIRGMAGNGAANDGGAIHMHFNGPANRREIEKWIADHSSGVADGLRRAARANVRAN
jgi:hypothetical protein